MTGHGVLMRGRVLPVLLAALLSASCTTFAPVKRGDLPSGLKAGDTVRVLTRDGREQQFEIIRVEPDAIVGARERVELADVALLEKREIHVAKTVGLTLAIVGAAAFVTLIITLATAKVAFLPSTQ